MTRTGQASVDYARSRVGTTMPQSGLCLQFVRTCFDVPSLYSSAIDSWNHAIVKHPGDRNPPPGVPLYFDTPSTYKHVTFCAEQGGAQIISTYNEDVRSFSSIASIESSYSGPYLGWAEDINAVTVYTGTAIPSDAGEGIDVDENTLRTIVSQESTKALRAEGVSGAGVWSLGQYPDGSFTTGSQAQKIVTDAVGDVMVKEGVAGAGDGTQPWAQTYIRQIVAEELAKTQTPPAAPPAAPAATRAHVWAALILLVILVVLAVLSAVASNDDPQAQIGDVVAGHTTTQEAPHV